MILQVFGKGTFPYLKGGQGLETDLSGEMCAHRAIKWAVFTRKEKYGPF